MGARLLQTDSEKALWGVGGGSRRCKYTHRDGRGSQGKTVSAPQPRAGRAPGTAQRPRAVKGGWVETGGDQAVLPHVRLTGMQRKMAARLPRRLLPLYSTDLWSLCLDAPSQQFRFTLSFSAAAPAQTRKGFALNFPRQSCGALRQRQRCDI